MSEEVTPAEMEVPVRINYNSSYNALAPTTTHPFGRGGTNNHPQHSLLILHQGREFILSNKLRIIIWDSIIAHKLSKVIPI